MKWSASAPANIALIKYMGKTTDGTNQAVNTSLSYTLDHLQSLIELETHSGTKDLWQPLANEHAPPLELSTAQQQRFLAHLSKLKESYAYAGSFLVRSGNTFPPDCGLASSASSFAALTRCGIAALSEITQRAPLQITEQAELSRQASGSSCRSFFRPWALWDEQGAKAIALPYAKLIHQVIIVDSEKKSVSSSSAHQRIKTSLLFADRAQRAETRCDLLITYLQQQDWTQAFQITWQEFWDMHALFETANPSFGYMTSHSLAVLRYLANFWEKHHDGPLVTMDAGPNIHLLYRLDQVKIAAEIQTNLAKEYKIIASD